MKKYPITPDEWKRVNTVQQIVAVRKNELVLMEEGVKSMIRELAAKYHVPEGASITVQNGEIVTVGEPNVIITANSI